MATLQPILRQLSYVETLGEASGPSDLKEVYLVDDALPDALELCRALPPSTSKILASKDTTFAHHRRCADANIDALIASPVGPRELVDWIEHFDARSSDRRATVLIIDDDELAAEGVAALLTMRGIEAEILGDPTKVFEVLDRSSFDLILLDLEMPQVNGVDLARMIRLNRSYLSVPIVFLSAGGDIETQMLARHFGGDDFISKRTPHGQLVRLVELRVERARVLRLLIERDGLTGLVDHARFVERAAQELARCQRTASECSLIMIDIDHFKEINDTWGHQTGDLVLRRLASALVSWLRRTDIIGRYGGEEFGVLMLDTPPERAAPVIDSFRRHFSALDMTSGNATFRVTFSAGVANAREAGDVASLIAASDAALYRAKGAGRNQIVLANAVPGTRSEPTETVPRAETPKRKAKAKALALHKSQTTHTRQVVTEVE
ncbi:MAG: diguanylate cyclase [Proteobacteria bacterium]|nr:diguanylate cyclase [Pseudomonadota bacterium]